MTFVDLTPSATTSNTGAVTGSSAHAALSDSSDASYVTFELNEGGSFPVSDLTLPSGAVLVMAQVWARTAKDSDAPSQLGALLQADSVKSGSLDVTWSAARDAATSAFIFGGLTDSGLDGASIILGVGLAWGIKVYRAWVRVMYLTKPTVTVTAPTSTVSVNRPTVQWTPAFDVHAQSVPHFREVKIFSQAQYSAGGFDPDSSAATVDSGVVSAAGSTFVSSRLADGNYRAYVRVAANNSPDQWSDWDYEAFTVDALEPGVPSFAATSQPEDGRVKLEIDDTSGDATTDLFQIQRSLDGSTWEDLRTVVGSGWLIFGGSALTIYDYEGPNGGSVSYRARAYNGTQDTYSDWASDTESWESNDEWFKCLYDPSLNLKLVVKSYAGFEVPSNQAVHRPLGSADPIVTADVPGPVSGQVVVFTKTEQEREDLSALLAAGSPVLMQIPGAPDRVVALGDRSASRVVDTRGELWHEETLGWTVVANPDRPLDS